LTNASVVRVDRQVIDTVDSLQQDHHTFFLAAKDQWKDGHNAEGAFSVTSAPIIWGSDFGEGLQI
jgi:hypothetical protein